MMISNEFKSVQSQLYTQDLDTKTPLLWADYRHSDREKRNKFCANFLNKILESPNHKLSNLIYKQENTLVFII